jgi:predicted nucleic-acid-binding Zn-ribbon protein
MVKHDQSLAFDAWKDACPICKKIVDEPEWPIMIQCGSMDDIEVKRGEKHPPCLACGSEEIKEEFLTMPTKDGSGVVHSRFLSCPSCGTGQYYEGVDAVTGKAKVTYKHPPELDQQKIRQEIEEHLKQGEQNEELLAKARFAIALEAFYRPLQYYCLDTGWDILGYGVRPLERTEIMTRFYEWTNKEAMSEADESDNPLRRDKKVAKKSKWWKN